MARLSNAYAAVLRSVPGSVKFNRVSKNARLLYLLLVTQCDVNGVFHGDPPTVWGQLFTHEETDQTSIDDVERLIDELHDHELIDLFNAEGSRVYLKLGEYYRPSGRDPEPRFPESGTPCPRPGDELSPDDHRCGDEPSPEQCQDVPLKRETGDGKERIPPKGDSLSVSESLALEASPGVEPPIDDRPALGPGSVEGLSAGGLPDVPAYRDPPAYGTPEWERWNQDDLKRERILELRRKAGVA